MQDKQFHPSYGWITEAEFAELRDMPLGWKKDQRREEIKNIPSAKKKRGERGRGKYVSQRWF